jgi:hypothetical protein
VRGLVLDADRETFLFLGDGAPQNAERRLSGIGYSSAYNPGEQA